MKPISEVFHGDCMDFMAGLPDGYFELAVVDPPYGIGGHKEQGLGDSRTGRNLRTESKWNGGAWDNNPPPPEYFKELFRISKNQIIWGGNYFPLPCSRCWIIWDKVQRCDNADAELAWTSFKKSVRIFTYPAQKLMGFMNPNRFHPTEKPVALYEWILRNYAKPGDKILDTHLGSQSSRIAAYKLGFDFWGCEIDDDYIRDGNARFEKEIAMPLFDAPKPVIQNQIAFPLNDCEPR